MRNATNQTSNLVQRRTVVIERPSVDISIGLQLSHVTEDLTKKSIEVSKIHPHSPASTTCIQCGWRLVEINGLNVHGYSMNTIVSLFKVASTKIQLMFEFESQKHVNERETELEAAAAESDSKKMKTVMCGAKSSFGGAPLNQSETNLKSNLKSNSNSTFKSNSNPNNANANSSTAASDTGTTIQSFFTQNMSNPGTPSLPQLPKLTAVNAKTVETLQRMYGFGKRSAVHAVVECGDDVQRCRMYIEEKRFQEDMNKAQILSEQQRGLDAERESQRNSQAMNDTKNLRVMFPQSTILDQKLVSAMWLSLVDRIAQQASDAQLRTFLIKLLELEKNNLQWFGLPARCYFEIIAKELSQCASLHKDACDVVSSSSTLCKLGQVLEGWIQKVEACVFAMPEVDGGVPPAFLKAADDAAKFDLHKDGFELVKQADIVKSNKSVAE